MRASLIRLRETFSYPSHPGRAGSLWYYSPYIVFRLLEGNLWIGLIDNLSGA